MCAEPLYHNCCEVTYHVKSMTSFFVLQHESLRVSLLFLFDLCPMRAICFLQARRNLMAVL